MTDKTLLHYSIADDCYLPLYYCIAMLFHKVTNILKFHALKSYCNRDVSILKLF